MKENQMDSGNAVINHPDYLSKTIVFLKKYLKYIVIALILGSIAGNCIAHYLIAPKYQSYLDLYVNVKNSSVDQNNDSVNTGDIDASKTLVNSYIVTLNSNVVTKQIVEKLDGRVSRKQLADSVQFASVNGTEVLRVTAETGDPQLSVDICNAYMGIAENVLDDIFGAGSVKVISSPELSTAPSSPDVIQYTLTGAILAAAIIALICLMIMLADNKVTSEKVLSERYSIPVLGSIPDFFQFSKTLSIPRKYVKKSKKLKGKNINNEKIITTSVVLGSKTPFPIAFRT